MEEKESITDLIVRVLEEIENAEYVIICVRYKEDENGDYDFHLYTNEPDIPIFREMMHDAIGVQYMEGEEEEDD